MMSAEKDSRIKLQPQSITKKRNVDDEGRIIEAKLEECVLRIKHTKLGDCKT